MIRSFEDADAQYIIDAHYDIYHREYGYDLSFKDFISNSVNDFISKGDRTSEHIWILDIQQSPKGSIVLTRVDDKTAQIRLFLVEPEFRGLGYGRSLIQQAIDFARLNHYETIILWTNRSLKSARHLYGKFGFKLVEQKMSVLSNQLLIEERWSLTL
ncbi:MULTISPECIES: GNAT family N-acetyltransferase [Alicyclobacillus]|uniref:GNAT family N-acetyltransferase n=1 Tax=Alicyclobacillus acidoterrestris (strain ATCC 49025 / DSM 3922 / CIP 106132 / NCIMB 13137 / GD3B) TaxID=1356854 RepID=T0BL03_ALIAG|nr:MULTISPECIES: GNAT family N-acetyltransferase [Alicyclobacillus]EPZ41419.1 hypothetical protein N007_17025 [Alicyclobacillus acidoterrestris ATCC 49025]UNO47764.1 GNAT family N-acetyltransferase [Alicyclobacillus acidoterrestris]GEO27594.1 GNAT family N-acetyltransferase [Alicyclobacillus acidoterrestris]